MAKKVSRYDSWKEKYSFEQCKLSNDEYGKYLSSYLRSQSKPLVLNLNGAWGTGKTVFLKQMYSDLRFTHEYPVIYIDAWRSDFSNDPLLVLISEFIEQFKNLSNQINVSFQEKQMLKVAAKFSKKLWNMSAIGVGTYLSGKTDNSAMVEAAKTLTFSDADAIQIGRNLADNYKAQLSSIEDTKKALSEYLGCFNRDKQKVFVLVDELDRCRPTYAIEMLETIKHFFSLDNYIFVVATDTDQLSHSINAVYGSNFDGTEYLSRFFNRSAALPNPNKKLFSNLLVKDSPLERHTERLLIFGKGNYSAELMSEILHEIGLMYNLSLRKMEQVFLKFEAAVLYELDNENRCFDVRLLIQLIAEYDSPDFSECYHERKKSDAKNYTLPNNLKDRCSTNDIVDLIHNVRKDELKELSSRNRIYFKESKAIYTFSWDLVNDFTNKDPKKLITIPESLQVVNNKVTGTMMNNASSNHADNVESELSNTTYNQLVNYAESCKYASPSKLHYMWTRKDYFKAVELSSTIAY